jgi:putative isomerase
MKDYAELFGDAIKNIKLIERNSDMKNMKPENIYNENMHKPVLAQHAAFLVKQNNGDAEWLREKFYFLQAFLNNYRNHHRHKCGLYYNSLVRR